MKEKQKTHYVDKENTFENKWQQIFL